MTTANECSRPGTLTANKILPTASEKRVKNATEELQKYIEKFTNVVQTKRARTPISRCYGSSNGSLLSTKPESFSSAKKHSRKATAPTEKQRKMADNLVQWVNESYSKDLQRKIVPFGQRSNSSVDTNGLSQTEGDGGSNDDEVSTLSDGDVQLSTLPSPGTSVVSDLLSDMGSVNTDVLLNSFYRHDNSQPSQGKEINHPSWVEELVTAKHYPSWIDDIDESHAGHQSVSRNQRNRLSRSLSPSFFREHSSPNPLSPLSTSLQDQPKEISDPQQKKAWDLESTDTAALISESIYGRQPVNMGGTFHHSLYHDKKIQQLHDCSVRKFAKDSDRSLIKEMSFAHSHIEDRKTSEHQSTQRLTKPRKTANPKTPVSKQHKKTTGHSTEAPNSFPHDRRPQNISENRLELHSFSKKIYPSTSRPSSLNLRKGDREVRKNSADSSNTDRLMRQSPTGIRIEKQDTRSRTIENSTRKAGRTNHSSKIRDRISTQIHSQKVIPTPNMRHSRNDFHTPSSKAAQRSPPNMRHSSKDFHTPSVEAAQRGPPNMRHSRKDFHTPSAEAAQRGPPNMRHSSKDFHTAEAAQRGPPNMRHSSKDFHTPSAEAAQRGILNVHHSSKNVHTSSAYPRRNASDELQRIIDEAESNEGQRKDHYLTGKVSKKNLTPQDRKNIFNNDRINSWKGSHTKRTEPNNYSTNGNLHGSYLPRTDLRTVSPRRLAPSDKYHGRIPENEDSESYGRSSSRTKIPWNSDPTKLGVAAKTSDHNLRTRSRTRSAPGMKDGHTGTFLPERGERYRGSLNTHSRVTRRDVDYANKRNILAANYADKGRISNADYANKGRILAANYVDKGRISDADYANEKDDIESIDTEALIIKPPMPLFDASPSLTTESAESTIGSEENGDTLIENLALRTSFLATELQSSSGTSYLEFKTSSPRHERDQNWEEENPPNARLNKPGIITSFLEDCMRSSEESRSDIHFNNGKFPPSCIAEDEESVMSEDSSSERPVETLKKMLFTVQRLAHSSEEGSDQGVNDQSLETQSEHLTEGVLSDILSTASHNEGQDSLSRAYYHLARLKRLVSASKEVAAWK